MYKPIFSMGLVELPPRARRILVGSIASHASHGTTSACAENTLTDVLKRQGMRNYLRVRGEYDPRQRHRER